MNKKIEMELENIKLKRVLAKLLEYIPIEGMGIDPFVISDTPKNRLIAEARELLLKD